MAYTLVGSVVVATVLTLIFLPALYAIWLRIKLGAECDPGLPSERHSPESHPASSSELG